MRLVLSLMTLGLMFPAISLADVAQPLVSYDQNPGAAVEYHLVLMTDGSVVNVTGKLAAPEKTQGMGQVPQEAVASIENMIDTAPADLKLEDPNQHGPYCNVYGSSSYTVYNVKTGKSVRIQYRSGCHTSGLPEGHRNLAPLIQLMDGFYVVRSLVNQ